MFTHKNIFIASLLCFVGYMSSVTAVDPVETMEHNGKTYEVYRRSGVEQERRQADNSYRKIDRAAGGLLMATPYVFGGATFTAPWDATFTAICKRAGSVTGKYFMIPATLVAAGSCMRAQQRMTDAQYVDRHSGSGKLEQELVNKHSNNSFKGWQYGYQFKEKTAHVKELPPHVEHLSA